MFERYKILGNITSEAIIFVSENWKIALRYRIASGVYGLFSQ